MKNQPFNQDKFASIIESLKRLPQVDPPIDIRKGIMASLPPKKKNVWAQLRRFLFQPHTVTFVPIKWAPVLAGLAILAVIPSLLPVHQISTPLVAQSVPAQRAALTFTFEAPNARQVALIGSFNSWVPDGGVRTEKQGNRWIFRIEVEPGRYEYAFLVDGEEIVPDPNAAFHRNNGFGTSNSIVYATANGQSNI
jgi:hypothetical protein